jgi:DNA-binding NarL/FixJ family response regulator
MEDRPRIRVVLIDDQEVTRRGLPHLTEQIEVVAAFAAVEDFLRAPDVVFDVILLDLQLDGPARAATPARIQGTAAIRRLREHHEKPIVIYTAIAEDMLLAACLAAGATGAVTKNAPGETLADVVRTAARGGMWVDPLVAGALTRYAERRHAGVLSPQQANALRYRGQGLKQRAIAEWIGVADPEIVHRYLKAAVDKLADLDDDRALQDPGDRHPGAPVDDLARRSGLASGLVRWEDLQSRRHRRPGRRG